MYSLLIIFSVNAIGKIKKNRKITAIKKLNNANKTLFTFFYIFGEQKMNVLRVNVEEDDEDAPVLLSNIYFFLISENF